MTNQTTAANQPDTEKVPHEAALHDHYNSTGYWTDEPLPKDGPR